MRSRSRSLSSLLLVVVGLLAAAPATAATLFISNTKGESISVIDTTTFEVTATIPLGKGKPNRVVFHPDGKTAWVVYDKSHDLGVVDADAHKLIKRVKIGGNPYNLNFTPDGRHLLVLDWSSEVTVSGMIQQVGARLMQGAADKITQQVFACIKAKLEAPVAI